MRKGNGRPSSELIQLPIFQKSSLLDDRPFHSQPGIFQKAGQFPAAESIDVPLSQEAQRFYKTGRPFLQGYLPLLARDIGGEGACRAYPIGGVAVPLV
ncbi:MAG: hypothetical protein KGL35_01860 [Bradyrhizobium sp.]|nr:hypothetical protein [Pseudomonadota bacterium]MDE2467509.1 hypothetical protein [Bradyrhizobium sp.]